jgi:hypothetical protein
MSAEFQLVLQFSASSPADYDALVALEDRLIETFGVSAQVDGHDFGSGEFNIFIFTADPHTTFASVGRLPLPNHNLRAAYREITGNQYFPLWPPDMNDFDVL